MGSDKTSIGTYQTTRDRLERLAQYVKDAAAWGRYQRDQKSIADLYEKQKEIKNLPSWAQYDAYKKSWQLINARKAALGSGQAHKIELPKSNFLTSVFKPIIPESTIAKFPLVSNPLNPLAAWGGPSTGVGPGSILRLGQVPYAGPETARITSSMTSPAALAITAATLGAGAWAGGAAAGAGGLAGRAAPILGMTPGILAKSTLGAIALGSAGAAAESAGVPVAKLPGALPNIGPRGAGEVVGGFYSGGIPFRQSAEQRLLGDLGKYPAPKMAPVETWSAGPTGRINGTLNLPEGAVEKTTALRSNFKLSSATGKTDIHVAPAFDKPNTITIDIGNLESTTGKRVGRALGPSEMGAVLASILHVLDANPGVTAESTALNPGIGRLFERFGFTPTSTGGGAFRKYTYTAQSIRDAIAKRVGPEAASLIGRNNEPTRSNEEIINAVNEAYQKTLEGGRRRPAVKAAFGSTEEKTALLNAAKDNPTAQAALQKVFIDRKVTPEQYAALKEVFGDFPARVEGGLGSADPQEFFSAMDDLELPKLGNKQPRTPRNYAELQAHKTDVDAYLEKLQERLDNMSNPDTAAGERLQERISELEDYQSIVEQNVEEFAPTSGSGIRQMEQPFDVTPQGVDPLTGKPVVPPTQEEWRAMWKEAGYVFPEDMPVPPPTRENGFPYQPGLGQEAYQYGLAPGAAGRVPVNPTPELPGFERPATQRGVLPEQQRPNLPPRYIEAGRQGYFPGMGSSLEYQPKLPGMETQTSNLSDVAKQSLEEATQLQSRDLLRPAQQLPLEPDKAVQMMFPPPEAMANYRPLTEGQRAAMKVQNTLGKALWNAAPEVQSKAKELLLKVSNGKLLSGGQRKWFEKNLGVDVADMFPRGASTMDEILGIANLPRAILASGDMSGTLRQAYVLNLGHPDIARQMLATQWRSFWSEEGARAFENELVKRTFADTGENVLTAARDAGLELPSWHSQEIGATANPQAFAQQEEAFLLGRGRAARFVEKAPVLRASQRAYVNGLNDARLSLFQKIIEGWQIGQNDIGGGPIAALFNNTPFLKNVNPQKWANDPGAREALATYINHATGRGGLGILKSSAPALNAIFFAPRLALSRFQVFGDLRHPAIRALVAKDLAQAYGIGASLLAMSALSHSKLGVGGTTVLDPRSADFGKLVVGNTHVDFFGGATPMIRLIAMMATGKTFTQAGEALHVNTNDVLLHFLQTKMAPVPGTIAQIASGKDITGKPVKFDALSVADKLVLENLTPLVIQDTLQAFWDEGLINGLTSDPKALFEPKKLAAAAATAPLSFMGVGTQTYEPSARTNFLERFREKYPNVDTKDRSVVNLLAANDPELSALVTKQRKEGLERGTEAGVTFEENRQFFAETEKQNHIPELAKLVLAGNADAGPTFVNAYQDYQKTVVDVLRSQFFKTETQANSPLAKMLQSYRDLTPPFDPITGETDWGTYFEQQDKAISAMKQMPNGKELVDAIQTRLRTTTPEAQQVEKMYKTARDGFHTVMGMSKYTIKGLNKEDEKTVDDMLAMREKVRQQLALQGLTNVDGDTVWLMVWKANPGVSPRLRGLAYNLAKADSFQVMNKDRRTYLIDHYKELSPFYPNLYRSRSLLMMIGAKYGRENVPNDLLYTATQP